MKVTAILASHNRRAQTLQCLASYFAQEIGPTVLLAAVVVDDGSADGTAEAVGDRFPETEIIMGDGNLFWAGAMAIAEQAALRQDPDHLLWLNDDVVLDPEALRRLIETADRRAEDCIAVGALRDPVTGELTYSGIRRRGLHPLRVDLVAPTDEPVEVETFNGNAVFVPRAVADKVGPFDGEFVHAAADLDYGLRARAAGVSVLLAPGAVGTCARGSDQAPWLDRSVSAWTRLRFLLGPKGVPPRARARYLRRHGGPIWILFWLTPYIRAAPSIMRPTQQGSSPR
jgi:GT2 family glycosyltransferase